MGEATRKGAAILWAWWGVWGPTAPRLALAKSEGDKLPPLRRPQTRHSCDAPPTRGGAALAGGIQLPGPQAPPAATIRAAAGGPGPRLGASGNAARGGRGGYAQKARPPAGRSRAGLLGPRGQNTATTLRGRFLAPSTYAGEDLGAAAPEKRQGRAAPEGLGLAFLTGGASARTSAPQGLAGAFGRAAPGGRTPGARKARLVREAAGPRCGPVGDTGGAVQFFHLPRPAAKERGREGVPGAGAAPSGAGAPPLGRSFPTAGVKKRAALRSRGSLLFSR